MLQVVNKELKLSASIVSYVFVLSGVIFLIPGYPILCSVFFVTLGIFQSFQNARETNDIVFSLLLPINKRDIVKGKYIFTCIIELCSMVLMTICVLLRMTIFLEVSVYIENPLMNANLFALGVSFVIFSVFNAVFVGGFFKTGYKFAKPFITYIILAFMIVGISETVHYISRWENVNAFGFDYMVQQITLFLIGLAFYIFITFISYKRACKRFETIDL